MVKRQRSSRTVKFDVGTLKYDGTNNYDAHKNSYQMYNKYDIVIRSL